MDNHKILVDGEWYFHEGFVIQILSTVILVLFLPALFGLVAAMYLLVRALF